MDLLLWRHAEAEDGFPDETRKLTPRGEQHAKQMAEWINKHAPKELRIIASPALRCQQTAQALGRAFETDTRLYTSGNACTLLAAAGWPGSNQNKPSGKAVLIVGHQPTLGQTAAVILGAHNSQWSIKKGALWWLCYRTRNHEMQIFLRAVLTPKVARALHPQQQ